MDVQISSMIHLVVKILGKVMLVGSSVEENRVSNFVRGYTSVDGWKSKVTFF